MRWNPKKELTAKERMVAKHLTRTGKFYLFLREAHVELFDEEFQARLATAYGTPRGTEPIPPSFLATVMLLQAYDQVGDAGAVESATLDLRWQFVLDCMGAEDAPFSQGVLVKFRERMIAHDLDKELLTRTVELAKRTGKFGWQHLKAVLDSSPLLGAGRVEDIWNLLGRALSVVVTCAAKVACRSREQVAYDAGLTLMDGQSLKASLDIDWDDPAAQKEALERLLGEVRKVEKWVSTHVRDREYEPALREALAALHKLLEQDIEPDPNGGGYRVKQGTAKDRMPSLGDKEMRHGRKSQSKKFVGYKRHILGAQGHGLILAAVALPANQAEHEAGDILLKETASIYGSVEGAMVDRGYLAGAEIGDLHDAGKEVVCKPWPSRNHGLFTKEEFQLQLDQGLVTCPAGATAHIPAGGGTTKFPAATCKACSLRTSCTKAKGSGRSISIHPREDLLVKLRALKKSPDGRALLRKRTEVEHLLARINDIQGPKARYKGQRKNSLDLRRCAAVANLQRARFLQETLPQQAVGF